MNITQELFGLIAGKEVYIFTISHSSGASIQVSNYGATWISAVVPDRVGVMSDVLLGYKELEGYLSDTNYMGSTVGRFANRINKARFTLHDQLYMLDKNDGENTNHGGYRGIHKQVFDVSLTGNAVVFSLKSPDGEAGFPGNVSMQVSYTFTEDLQVAIRFRATTDKDTYLNLTNHAYINLAGTGNILQHSLYIPSSDMLETDEYFIPTGKILPVQDTVFDFSHMKPVEAGMDMMNEQIIRNKGFNHCYPIFQTPDGDHVRHAATLSEHVSGRKLEVFTTLPSVLVYSAGFLVSLLPGKSGKNYQPFDGICLEAQYYPDSPNQPHFPSCILRKDDTYDHTIEFRFSVD